MINNKRKKTDRREQGEKVYNRVIKIKRVSKKTKGGTQFLLPL